MKLLIIGATHGDELLGVKLYEHLLLTRSILLEYVDFVIGNPRAYTAKKRYIDTDLNRSYQKKGNLYEEERAQEIKNYIDSTQPDLVIDMHTTTCEQPSCIITAGTDGEIRQRFLRACHVSTILQVRPMGDIASLGNFVVAYEVPNRDITPTLLDNIAADLERFVAGTGGFEEKRLFTMSDKIYKKDVTDEQVSSFINFEMNSLGFVPIMTGENSYKRQTDYLGFKSPAPEEIKV